MLKLYIQNALENWQKKYAKLGLEFQYTTIHSKLFADDHLQIPQHYEYLEVMTRKVIDEYDLWGLKLIIKKKLNIWPYETHQEIYN
jgi:hypothetical protein